MAEKISRAVRGLREGRQAEAYNLILDAYEENPEEVMGSLLLIAEAGSWSDLYRMLDVRGRSRTVGPVEPVSPGLARGVADLYAARLLLDERGDGKVSGAARCAPREGSRYHWFAKELAARMPVREKRWKEYRRVVTKLRQRQVRTEVENFVTT